MEKQIRIRHFGPDLAIFPDIYRLFSFIFRYRIENRSGDCRESTGARFAQYDVFDQKMKIKSERDHDRHQNNHKLK